MNADHDSRGLNRPADPSVTPPGDVLEDASRAPLNEVPVETSLGGTWLRGYLGTVTVNLNSLYKASGTATKYPLMTFQICDSVGNLIRREFKCRFALYSEFKFIAD